MNLGETSNIDADEHSASPAYAARFAGKIGTWLLQRQTDSICECLYRLDPTLKQIVAAPVLDVGGGHGQIAPILQNLGSRVTVLASSEAATQQLRSQTYGPGIKITTGNLLNLPFPECSFAITTCFRIVSHTPDWKRLIGELCRVSQQAVMIDYPSFKSINALSESLFSIKRRVEGNTRTFTVFKDAEIEGAFRENGFDLLWTSRQFGAPMVLHRGLKSPFMSQIIESICRAVGFQSRYGSPVTLIAIRRP